MNCQSDISDLMCMMPCHGIMADVPAQSQHICSDVQDYEHQWSCWLHQHYWFVVVVVWVVGCCWVGVGLGGVSPPFNWNPLLRTTQVLSSAYHVHMHMSIYLCTWCTTAAVWLCSYTVVPPSLLGALQFVWTTHERQCNGRHGLCGAWQALGTSWVSPVVVACCLEWALSFLLIISEWNGQVVPRCHTWVWCLQCLANSGDLLEVPSGGCTL